MEKQEAIELIHQKLKEGCDQAEITAELSRKLGVPSDIVGRFVTRVIDQSPLKTVEPSTPLKSNGETLHPETEFTGTSSSIVPVNSAPATAVHLKEKKIVFLQADKDLSVGFFVEALDIVKKRILQSTDEDTVVSKAYTGKTLRARHSGFHDLWDGSGLDPLPFPIQIMISSALLAGFIEAGKEDYVALTRLEAAPGALICCDMALWSADGSRVYSANSAAGMFNPGLWQVNPLNGDVTTLLASNYDTSEFNLAKYPYLALDNQLYFFFLASNTGEYSRTPLQLVRSAPDGVTGRTVVREEKFDTMNEALWAPDASFVIVVKAPSHDVYQGGVPTIVYLDGRPDVPLADFAQHMEWGP